MLFALATAALAAEKGFLWDGTQWKDMTTDIKVAYVKGIGNMADFENAAGGSGQAACISKGFVAELKTRTIAQVIAEVDKFYKENPAKLDLPVVAVILQRCTKLCAPTAEKK
jgi:citrate lyase alpha subunit